MHKPENIEELEQKVDEQIVPGCMELREFVLDNKSAFDTISKEFLDELVRLSLIYTYLHCF
jgi:hypothetical protein